MYEYEVQYLYCLECTVPSAQSKCQSVHIHKHLPQTTVRPTTCDVLQQQLALNLHGDAARAWE